jgi:hypothetical protein
MTSDSEWVDGICESLGVAGASPWVKWSERERSDALGDPANEQGVSGVYLIGWGASEADIELVYIAGTGRSRARLSRLEHHVKWGMNYGFRSLREFFERRGDHRTMSRVWVKMIPIDEQPLFSSALLTPGRVNALGAKRRQLETILLAEYYRRYGVPVPGNRDTAGLFLREQPAAPEAGDMRRAS